MRLAVVVSVALLVLGCEGSRTLTVDLRTDFVGGVEFTAVQTDVLEGPPDGPSVDREVLAAFADPTAWFRGRRVAEVSGLSGEDYTVRVSLLRADGSTVAARLVRVTVRSSYALVVVITRDCQDVVCPGPGDPAEALTCFGGRCVDPRCGAAETADACPDAACVDATACPAAAVPCVRPACVEGACLFEPTGACASDEYCDVALGCRRDETSMDAGVPEDGGPVPRDAGVDGGGGCVPGDPCDAGEICAVGRIECLDGDPVCVASEPAPASTVCRPAAGPCDVAETCGGAMVCPDDALEPGTTECREAAGECDAAETCTGASPDCPADVAAGEGTVCSAGVCIGGACVPCMPGLGCDLGPCERGVIDCSGGTPTCGSSRPAPAGIPCRAAAGPCDVAEMCDGSSITCPTDRFLGASTTCRPAVGPCDRDDVCSGAAAACPADRFAAAGTECRMAAGLCDVAETCSGVGTGCPGDVLRAGGTECRASTGGCDVAEVCSGIATTCPTDARRSAGTECRAAAGACDVAEQCDGSSATCPTDRFVSAGTECRPEGDMCNPAEACDGASAACPADATTPDDTACGLEGCAPFGACTGTGCDLTAGTQTSTCTTPVCRAGSCSGFTMRPQMQDCTRAASCPDACCNGTELGDTCAADCGAAPVGVTAGATMYTPTVGNGSGTPFEDVCPADQVVNQISLDYVSSEFFEGLVTYCRPLSFVANRTSTPVYDVALGSTVYVATHGGDGWTTWDCPAGQVLTGFRAALIDYMGRSVIDALEMRCSTIATSGRVMPGVTITYGTGGTVLVDEPVPPPAGPFTVTHDCPAGTVARGFRGAYSTGSPNVLERFGLVCQSITPR